MAVLYRRQPGVSTPNFKKSKFIIQLLHNLIHNQYRQSWETVLDWIKPPSWLCVIGAFVGRKTWIGNLFCVTHWYIITNLWINKYIYILIHIKFLICIIITWMNEILMSYKNNNERKSKTEKCYINNVQKLYFPVFPTLGVLDRARFPGKYRPVITTMVFPGQPCLKFNECIS